jgi:hypothetical protein
MSELNSILNGTSIPFKLNNDEQEFNKLYGKDAEGSYRSTYQFDKLADENSGKYRLPQGKLKPPVAFGLSKDFLWGQSVEPVKHGGYRPSGSNIDGNTIPKAVIQKTQADLGGERAAERYTTRNAYIRQVA